MVISMPTIDPNKPGYYTDGTPIPGYTPNSTPAKPPGYPIGVGMDNPLIPPQDPDITQRASLIRAASGDTPPIQRPGNPYNAQGARVTHITADNKTVDSGRNAYDYYGVPTLASRTQGNEQYEFQEKLKQWAAEFEEQKRQNRFGNGISVGNLTGYYGDKKVSVPSTGTYRSPTGGGYYVNGVLQ